MSANVSKTTDLGQYRKVFALAALAILAVPLVAMQFTAEVRWTAFDFLVFVTMLAALGGAIELAIRFAHSHLLRAAFIGLSLMAFLFVWAMLATG
ncbi:hypothetical protein [Qipengyuania nanhaisediminis]|uniref:hypothetical protein n=1 Tax=Qipengyuania nanhaisediminis TaxID=604088 RepID=UPI0038B39A33